MRSERGVGDGSSLSDNTESTGSLSFFEGEVVPFRRVVPDGDDIEWP